jgi:hypothetical protein
MSGVKKQFSMQPTTLRLLLTLLLFGIAILTIVGFTLVQQKLSAYALEVSHIKVDATGSQTSLQTLQSVQKQLIASEETINKASSIKHNSQLPQFKAIEDIRNHADANNISISNISFTSATTTPAAGTTPPAPTATPAAPVAQADGIDISFTIDGGFIDTVDFINFLYDIEHSTPKLQVEGITVAGGPNKSSVKVDKMTIKMFTT